MEISRETFAAVVRAASSDIDWKEFAIRIAEEYPEQFIQTAEDVMTDSWKPQAREMASESNKVQTIKFIREQTGMGLLEAKGLTEQFIEEKNEDL